MDLKDNKYQISGVDLLTLAEKYGTPVYIYDAETIKRQYLRLTNAFSEVNMKVRYACKSLINQNILRLLKNVGSGLDTVSIQEVQLGLMAEYDTKEIIFTLNGVSIE